MFGHLPGGSSCWTNYVAVRMSVTLARGIGGVRLDFDIDSGGVEDRGDGYKVSHALFIVRYVFATLKRVFRLFHF